MKTNEYRAIREAGIELSGKIFKYSVDDNEHELI